MNRQAVLYTAHSGDNEHTADFPNRTAKANGETPEKPLLHRTRITLTPQDK